MEIDVQHNAALAKVAEMVGDARFAMLTTKEKDGTLRSRPMATMQLDSEGNLWFLLPCHPQKSRKRNRTSKSTSPTLVQISTTIFPYPGQRSWCTTRRRCGHYGLRGSSPGSQRAWTIRISLCSKSASWQSNIGMRPTVLLHGHTDL